MEERTELVIPSLEEMERIYITHVLHITGTRDLAAKLLNVTTNTLYNKMRKHKIPFKRVRARGQKPKDLDPSALKVGVRETGRLPDSVARNHNGNQGHVTYSVTPEERDYYYNLDFLCGVYRNLKTHCLTPDPDAD